MACSEEAMNLNKVTDILFNTFGAVLDRETIYSIVDSCDGDLDHAAHAIMSITSEEPPPVEDALQAIPNTTDHVRTKKSRSRSKHHAAVSTKSGIETKSSDKTPSLKMSYAAASTSKKKQTKSKHPEKSFKIFPQLENNCTIWTEQIKRIVTYHNQGTRTLIIMRGAPGSGKSYLASQILEMTVGYLPKRDHIFSTDDYFIGTDGYYRFEKKRLPNAHQWTQERAGVALNNGVSPVIIDNTNIECREMSPYAKFGVSNGYLIEVVEPTTPWARNLNALSFRNKHSVPTHTIKRMLKSLDTSITSASLIDTLQLDYPPGLRPPVVRSLPKYAPCFKDKCSKEKAISPLQEKNVEIQDSKIEAKHIEYCPSTTQNIINSEAEISEMKGNTNQNQQIKYTVKEEGDSIKVLLDMENIEMNCDETATSEKKDLIKYSEEKDYLNEKIETLVITEDQNTVLKAELTEQGYTSYIDDKVEENNLHSLQNIMPPPEPKDYIEGEMIVTEPSELDKSKCRESRGDQDHVNTFMEVFQKVMKDWDDGESWDEDKKTNNAEAVAATQLNTDVDPKSPRSRKIREGEKTLQFLYDENDWRKMYTPMTSFTDKIDLSPQSHKNVVVMKTSETCIEFGDTDTSGVKNDYKVLSTIARDINLDYVPNLPERIPEYRKFDKSSLTDEFPLMFGGHRCRNQYKHFIRFRNMFKNVKKEDLKDIFDNCCGDANWAVNILMDAVIINKIKCIPEAEQSEVEDENALPCDCSSSDEIIPDVTHSNIEEEHIVNVPSTSTETSNPTKKQKKDYPLSDSSLALKRQIEQNIVISDQHYSEHSLKIRKMRRGELDGNVSTSQNIATGITIQNQNESETFSSNDADITDINTDMQKINETNSVDIVDSEYNSDDESLFNEVQKTVNITVGYEFLTQLDSLFGRGDMTYTENIEPRINMPLSMLNEINALWMESLMFQLETESKTHEEMIKQDEEFARELAMEQEALIISGKEQEVPNLKEIMDMEFALSLYRKDCEELMQKERPTDMATKLSSKKLHDLFPEIPDDDLDQILMAHNYDFKTTVGVLLETQGRTDITEVKNGVNKFIMAQELERQEKYLAAEKKKLMDQTMTVELPDDINMDTVKEYRKKAKLHWENWNKTFGKAKKLVKKNAALASYYSSLARLHLLQYEHANSVAAITLLQIHARNSESHVTLDLHFLHVKEALAALDMFLDSHIDHLRMVNLHDGKYPALFIITGRGLHSRGAPKIKPAAQKLLENRELLFKELNPGLFAVKVYAQDKLSFEVT